MHRHCFMSCLRPGEGVGLWVSGFGVQGLSPGWRSEKREHRHLAVTPVYPPFQMLLSQLLPLDSESTQAEEENTKEEGSSSGPQLLSSTLPFLPSGARAARAPLWRKTLTSRKWALPGDWAWKAVPRGCFGLKLDRIGTFSGLGC